MRLTERASGLGQIWPLRGRKLRWWFLGCLKDERPVGASWTISVQVHQTCGYDGGWVGAASMSWLFVCSKCGKDF